MTNNILDTITSNWTVPTYSSMDLSNGGLLNNRNIYSTNTYTISNSPLIDNTVPKIVVADEIILKGENISEILSEIRDSLRLLERDILREEKYKELKDAADEYHKILKRLKSMEVVTDGEI